MPVRPVKNADKARRGVELRAAKRRQRPVFHVSGTLFGLSPEDIEAFRRGVEEARGRHLREHRAHQERMRQVEIP